jgi:flagellin
VEQEENSISFLVGLDGDETLEPGLPRDMSSPTLGLSALSVVTPTEARAALDALPDILHSISSARADMGAVLNRLESIANNAANRDLNEVRAGGRVMDADVAAETARLTRSNLLVQQGASIASKLGAIQRDFVLTLLSST